jgi:hypothetical protein
MALLQGIGVMVSLTILFVMGDYVVKTIGSAPAKSAPETDRPARDEPKSTLSDVLPEPDRWRRDLRAGDEVEVYVFKGTITNRFQQIASRWQATLTGKYETDVEFKYEVEYPDGRRQMVPPLFIGFVRHAPN